MGRIGERYGSEYHFLHYRAERPSVLDALLLKPLGGPDARLEWVYPTGAEGEREPQGLEFLSDREDVQALWRDFWPQRGRGPTWDGVAVVHANSSPEWVLIEAKANTVEFVTPSCGAVERGGREQIETALNRVKAALGVHRHYSWLGSYYQYANRLAVLHFLNEQARVPARLLHVYFTGDCFPDGRECPGSAEDWKQLIEARRITLGLPHKHLLSDRTHEAFVPVEASNASASG
jgi:hypothetical protein